MQGVGSSSGSPGFRFYTPNQGHTVTAHWLEDVVPEGGRSRRSWLGVWALSNSVGASLVAQMIKSLPAMQETQVQSLGHKDPLRRK